MPFHARETFYTSHSDLPIPGKVYVHSAGFKEVYNGDNDTAFDYFLERVAPHIQQGFPGFIPSNADYFLSALWGSVDMKWKMADVFFFRDFGNKWPGNPEVTSSVFRNGGLITRIEGVIGCGDGMIMLGAEEKLRRSMPDLASYIASEVPISELPWEQL